MTKVKSTSILVLMAVSAVLTGHRVAAADASPASASAGYKFARNYVVLAKVAYYQEDGSATDTTRLWLQFSATF